MSIGFKMEDAEKHKTGRIRQRVFFPEVGRTKPEFKESCDVNYILKKYKMTGTWDMVGSPLYGDYSDVVDYQEACNIQIRAQEQFENLPSELRNRFQNDPSKFLEYVNDEKNNEEMWRLGLLNKSPFMEKETPDLGEQEPAE